MKTSNPEVRDEEVRREIILMRHGRAVAAGTPAFPDDAARPLTPEGKRKLKEIAKGLGRLDCKIAWIVSSPFVRAVETAKIIAAGLPVAPPFDTLDSLGTGEPLEPLLAFLEKHPDKRRILIVGHEPQLSEMAARLIGAGRSANLAFKKGGCCLIRFEALPAPSQGKLIWWLTPSLLRSLS
jgi:phosphohistidine phosphatase